MSTETVSIGCRLPAGIELEIGYTVSAQGGGGVPFARVQRLANYHSVTLKGTNQSMRVRDPESGRILTTLPSRRDPAPYLNHGVPKDFWTQWVAEHPDSWLIKSGQLFVVPQPDKATVTAASLDAKATSAEILQPVDPTVPFKVEDVEITKRDDAEVAA